MDQEELIIDPTLIEEENPKHSQDEISQIAGVDLDFNTTTFPTDDEEKAIQAAESAAESAVVEVKREASQEAVKGAEEVAEEAAVALEEAKTSAVVQAKVAEEVAEEEGRPRRKSVSSFKVAENMQLAAEAEAAKREAAAKSIADQQTKREAAERAAQIVNQPLSQVSVFTGPEGSIAKRMIIKNIRLESYDPTSQAKIIFGDTEFFNHTRPDSRCYLCGFKFEDRISFHHNKTKNYVPPRITWSFDHFVPINFSAVVFRIPVAKGKSKYTRDELELLKVIGGMACYHCNYEKSQRMFITCEKEGQVVNFNNFKPNDNEIRSFLNDLYKSENKHGWGKNPGERTLNLCFIKNGLTKKAWLDQRFKAIQTLAYNVCNLIKQKVDRSKVETRIRLTKVIVQKAKEDLLEDDIFNKLTSQEGRYRYSRVYIAGLFGAAELTFPTPWKYVGVRIMNPIERQQLERQQIEIQKEREEEERIRKEKLNKVQKILEEERGSVRKNVEPRSRSTSRIKSGSRHKRIRKITRKNKRKTYRGVRLF